MSLETKEREARKGNIVVYGVKESKKGEVAGKKEDDKKMAEIAEEIGVTLREKPELKWRIGRPTQDKSKPRPMLIRIGDKERCARLMENAKKLSRKPEW